MATPDSRNTRPTSTILRSTRDDGAHHAEIDREEHADRDQRDLRFLEDAEPQDEQRHPGDRGDGAQRLQASGRTGAAPAPSSRRSRRAACRPATPRPNPAANTKQRRSGMARKLAGRGELGQRRVDTRRRRHQAAVRQSELHGGLPGHRKAHRQQQAKQRSIEPRERVGRRPHFLRRLRERLRTVIGTSVMTSLPVCTASVRADAVFLVVETAIPACARSVRQRDAIVDQRFDR